MLPLLPQANLLPLASLPSGRTAPRIRSTAAMADLDLLMISYRRRHHSRDESDGSSLSSEDDDPAEQEETHENVPPPAMKSIDFDPPAPAQALPRARLVERARGSSCGGIREKDDVQSFRL